MKTKNLIFFLAIVAIAAGCTVDDSFTRNAKKTTRKELRVLLHENKVNVTDIIIGDTCWKIPTCYDDPVLAELDQEYTRRTTRTDMPSDDEFIDEVLAISDLKKKIAAYTKENTSPWGYKAKVAYKIRGQVDTVTCEISLDGKETRTYSQGPELPETETLSEIQKILGL